MYGPLIPASIIAADLEAQRLATYCHDMNLLVLIVFFVIVLVTIYNLYIRK